MLILSTLFMVIGVAALCIAAMLYQMSRARVQPYRVTSVTVLAPGDET
jgi:hypothetical protein